MLLSNSSTHKTNDSNRQMVNQGESNAKFRTNDTNRKDIRKKKTFTINL